jgi:WD40 repeat protein
MNKKIKVKIWDLISGKLIRTLSGHTDYVLSLARLNNNTLASGSADKSIKIWNTKI